MVCMDHSFGLIKLKINKLVKTNLLINGKCTPKSFIFHAFRALCCYKKTICNFLLEINGTLIRIGGP